MKSIDNELDPMGDQDETNPAQEPSAPQPMAWESVGPSWLYDDDEIVVNAREQLLGDYNIWIQLSGGTRQTALDVFVQDYPNGPLKAGGDGNLRQYLGARFPWLPLYQIYGYRTGIFNTLTFVVIAAGLGFMLFVYQPKPKTTPTGPLVTPDSPAPAK